MNVLIVGTNTGRDVRGEFITAHGVQLWDVDASVAESVDWQSADVIVTMPSAVQTIRARQTVATRRFMDDVPALIERGVVFITLFASPSREVRRVRGKCHVLTSPAEIQLLGATERQGRPRRSRGFISSLIEYLEKHATCCMATPHLSVFLPVVELHHPTVLRTPIHGGGTELLLPLCTSVLDTASFALIMIIGEYYRDGTSAPRSEAWQENLHLFRDEVNCGTVSYHEYESVCESPERCFDVLVDVVGMRVYRRKPNGEMVQSERLAPGEMMEALDIFLRLGVPSLVDNKATRFFQTDGRPYVSNSIKSRIRLRNRAINKVNTLGALIKDRTAMGRVAHYFDRNVGHLGVIVRDACLHGPR